MDQEGNSNPDCFPCPGGKYCGAGDKVGGQDCSPGYYCTTRNTVPEPGWVLLFGALFSDPILSSYLLDLYDSSDRSVVRTNCNEKHVLPVA